MAEELPSTPTRPVIAARELVGSSFSSLEEGEKVVLQLLLLPFTSFSLASKKKEELASAFVRKKTRQEEVFLLPSLIKPPFSVQVFVPFSSNPSIVSLALFSFCFSLAAFLRIGINHHSDRHVRLVFF